MTDDFALPLLRCDGAALLVGESLLAGWQECVERASRTLDVSMFLLALAVDDDPTLVVRQLCDAVHRALLRGVRVRILVDAFEGEGVGVNLVAAYRLDAAGACVRVHGGGKRPTNHSKYLIADERHVLVASGNWTTGGLASNLELGLLVDSPDVAAQLTQRFAALHGEGLPLEPLP